MVCPEKEDAYESVRLIKSIPTVEGDGLCDTRLTSLDMDSIMSDLGNTINQSDFSENDLYLSTFCFSFGVPTVLHYLMLMARNGYGKNNNVEAVDLVLALLKERSNSNKQARKNVMILVNMKVDRDEMTLLHLAIRNTWGKKVVMNLLNLGADFISKSCDGETPFSLMGPLELEEILDDMWTMQEEENVLEHSFDFTFLQRCSQMHWDERPQMILPVELFYSSEKRHLLLHPVINTFLALRWREIANFYVLNIVFTLLSCFNITLFILLNYGGDSVSPLSRWPNQTSCAPDHPWTSWRSFPSVFEDPCMGASWGFLVAFTLVMWVREVSQGYVAFNNKEVMRHLGQLENWLEVIFLVCTTILILTTTLPQQPVCAMRAVAATSLLLSWVLATNVVVMMPYFHQHNIYITMFFNVMKKFGWIFLIFFFYIFAFGLFFYFSLHKDFPEKEADGKGVFMDKIGLSVLKTLTMFVGELEFSDMPFSNMPYISHLAFVLFVLIFVVVLMNLLTGLAVRLSPHSYLLIIFISGW